ncbi:MAG TPA: ABC transporter substrate-binding protein [Chloroflexota bacterium]|nr:ABC transporter substrate-binding protein [Chloroflexota bacterium]
MSALDQPLLIANSNYHVGQQMSIRIAEEQGYFREEGFTSYVYESGGLVPGPFEPEALGLVMKERGVDIATAVDVGSVLRQRSLGEELYIVGGWRYSPNMKFFGAKDLQGLADLRGRTVGIREAGSLQHILLGNALRKAGVDPDTEVSWVYDGMFSYGNDPRHVDALRTGKVDALSSQPPFTNVLASEGFPVLLDPFEMYPGGKPDKVIVATRRTVEQRTEELTAFLRGNIRGFWGMRDNSRYDYLRDLETRLRQQSHNDQERSVRIITSIEKVEGWTVPADGGVSREALARVIDEAVEFGEIDKPLAVDDVLRDQPVKEAYAALKDRPELQEIQRAVAAAVEKYGF